MTSKNLKGRVFFYIDENGKATDKGIVDECLANEEEIDARLIKEGIIKKFIAYPVEKKEKKP